MAEGLVVPPLDDEVAAQTQALLDQKTKPRGSLGRLERLACRLAAIRGQAQPPLPKPAVLLLAADHGVAAMGVSAYPQAVTREMLQNLARGGAAISVLAEQAGATLRVADLGSKSKPEPSERVRDHRIAPCTKNFTLGPAMSLDKVSRALAVGSALVSELRGEGHDLLALGELGIANTTSASALACALGVGSLEALVGRGTGLDDAGLALKREVVGRAVELHAPEHMGDPLEVLRRLGGLEIAGLVGATLTAAGSRIPVVLDGFITSVAALVAARLQPNVKDYLLASHRSVEPGHGLVLAELGLEPLFDYELRLGEGTGAALALPHLRAAVAILHDMATFAEAEVSDSGR